IRRRSRAKRLPSEQTRRPSMTSAQHDTGGRLKVGFIGIGNMGGNRAARIAKGGFDFSVFDLREDPVNARVARVAKRAGSVEALAGTVDALCRCVSADEDVQAVALGEGGVFASARPGLVFAIHSTVLPQTVIDLARRGREFDVEVLDAPVS